MANNPTNYNPNLPRVSSIVEFVFPFEWEGKDRFLDWLDAKWVSLEDYMEEACTGGTYVHKAMEDYANWEKVNKRKYKKIIDNGILFHKESEITTLYSEYYVSCNEYQWTIDRVAQKWDDIWIIDFKTYSLAKAKFNLTSVYRKPYSKLVKAKLQLNLYKRALKKLKLFKWKNIRLFVVELNEDKYYIHELETMVEAEIKTILKQYKLRYGDEI